MQIKVADWNLFVSGPAQCHRIILLLGIARQGIKYEFDGDLFRNDLGRAAKLMTQIEPRDSWSPR